MAEAAVGGLTMPRVAIACSGLGHVQRGVEAWAADLARALPKAGVEVTLFGAGPTGHVPTGDAPTGRGSPGHGVVLPCLQRTRAGGVARLLRHAGGWHYGCGSPYEVEQTTFSAALWPRIRRGFDILHVQDPTIARWFEAASRHGLSAAKVVYANGTGETATVMRRFGHLQLLTATAMAEWLPQRPAGQMVFMIPNFIDTARFTPADQRAARARFDLPQHGTIVLCCAAIRRYHKRIDYLLAEFATLVQQRDNEDCTLVIAGGREADTDALIAQGTAMLGKRVRFLPALPREQMPELYRAADVFTLVSLQEMFGIVLLEAMASGLPVLCHDAPAFRAIVGEGGVYQDLSAAGGWAAGFAALAGQYRRAALADAARRQVVGKFSESVVVRDIVAMYRSVLAGNDALLAGAH